LSGTNVVLIKHIFAIEMLVLLTTGS